MSAGVAKPSPRPASRRRPSEPAAFALIEEAVHLLRRAPASTLAIYYAGTVPGVLAFLFFWAHASWFNPAPEQVAWAALGLTAMFAATKTAQAAFCARLYAQRTGAPPAPLSARGLLRLAAAQLRVQAWALLVLPLAAVFTLPLAWAWAFFQNAAVPASDGGASTDAWSLAKLWPRQNHLGLLILGVLALYVWINLAMTVYLLPWLANRLIAVENVAGVSGWSWMNTTFLSSVTALTWLAVDPLVKAFYVLRVFHGCALHTGEDLRIELARTSRAARAPSARGVVALLAASLVAHAFFSTPLLAVQVEAGPAETVTPTPAPTPTLTSTATPTGSAPPAAVVEGEALDAAIDAVLAGGDFRWQLPPLPKPEKPEEELGVIARFLRQGGQWIGEAWQGIVEGFKRFEQWVRDLFPERKDAKSQPSASGGGGLLTLRVVLYGIIALFVLLLGFVAYLIWKRARLSSLPAQLAAAVTFAQPDLADEQVQASQLPVDGWLALAHEQIARGEWRLALRALYLATLARLGTEGFLTLARFKTNLDYERELARRAAPRTALHAWFRRRRNEFEATWYGRAQAGEAQVRAWLADFDRERPLP